MTRPLSRNILALAGDKLGPFPGQTGRFLLNSTVKLPFVPFVPGTGWVRPWNDCLERLSCKGRQNNVYVFSVYWFSFAPNQWLVRQFVQERERHININPFGR